MKNFNFKNAFEALAVIGMFTTMFTLVYVFLPRWVFGTALAVFILFCFYLVGRKKQHYWIYFIFRRNGNNVIGVVETTGDYVLVPDKAVDEYEQLIGFNVYEISKEQFKSLYKALSEESVNQTATNVKI